MHLETRDLRVTRGDVTLLANVNVGFRSGVVTALLGPSGAGKTTLLRCLNGLEPMVSGSVLLDGDDIETIGPTELRRRVGLVFQLPMALEGTVRDNITYGLDSDGVDAEAALRNAGLDSGYLEREATSLSVGEAQRLSIARALVREPEVLLMDEPTSALDRDSRAQIETLVRGLVDTGLTLVVVTHDLGQAERVADDACLLVAGVMKAQGHPRDLHEMWETHK